jgi:hypothetical protein
VLVVCESLALFLVEVARVLGVLAGLDVWREVEVVSEGVLVEMEVWEAVDVLLFNILIFPPKVGRLCRGGRRLSRHGCSLTR